MAIKDGDTIKIDYTGTLDDGTVFDSSEDHGQPLEFTVGTGQVIPGFDDAVRGMEEGEEKEVRIEPDQAYGPYNDELTRSVPKENIPEEMEVQIGMMLGIQLPDGEQIPARVAQINDEAVLLDMNHPLAGQALTFNIQVKEISS